MKTIYLFVLLASCVPLRVTGQDPVKSTRNHLMKYEYLFRKRGLQIGAYDYSDTRVNETLQLATKYNKQAQLYGATGTFSLITGILTLLGSALVVADLSTDAGNGFLVGAIATGGGIALLVGAEAAGRKRDDQIVKANALLIH